MRILGIDYGDSRVGVAVSDELCILANRLCVIDGKKGRTFVASEILRLAREKNADTVVIGYPLNMDGSKGPRIKVTEKFARELGAMAGESGGIKIEFWDERLTTKIADSAMRDMNVHQKQKGVSDEIAAMVILQNYLDNKRKD